MIIYMRHPVHGTKVAISDIEAAADEKAGWERYQVGALLTPADEPREPVVVPDNELAKRKPGRPAKQDMVI